MMGIYQHFGNILSAQARKLLFPSLPLKFWHRH